MSAEFMAVWPITDRSVPRSDLVVEALRALPAVARRHRVQVAGVPVFRVLPGRLVPGSAGADEVLVARCPAVPLARPSDPQEVPA